MNPTDPPEVSLDDVAAAATLVGLPLRNHDASSVADLLSQWIPAARTLSTRMQAEENTAITPITVFGVSDTPGNALLRRNDS